MNPDQMAVIKWLFSGDVGVSSRSLAAEFFGVSYHSCDIPWDPDDMGRCLRLIKIVPAIRQCVDTLADKHSGWKKIAPAWDAISASMEAEVGIDWSKGQNAPKTYKMMREVRS